MQKIVRFRILALALPVAILAAGLSGCSSTSEPVDKVVVQAQTEMEGLATAARAAGGDYSKLSQSDKDKFLARVAGNEQAASDMVQRMAGGGGPRGAGGK